MKAACNAFALAFLIVAPSTGVAAPRGDNADIRPGEAVNGLRLEARTLLVNNPDKGNLLIVRAWLINEGEQEATVLTSGLGPSFSRDAVGPVVGFNLTAQMKHGGRPVVPSLTPYHPVTLRPGEVALLTAQMPKDLREDEVIRVGYFVTEPWGQRLGLWHGYTCTKSAVVTTPPRNGQ